MNWLRSRHFLSVAVGFVLHRPGSINGWIMPHMTPLQARPLDIFFASL